MIEKAPVIVVAIMVVSMFLFFFLSIVATGEKAEREMKAMMDKESNK